MVALRVRCACLTLVLWAACDGSTDGAADLATDLTTAPCSDPDPPAGSVCPITVRGSVVDDNAAVVPNLLVSVCAGLCFFGNTDSSGTFAVTPDAHVVPAQYAFELHGRPDHVTYYTPLPASFTYDKALPLPSLPTAGTAIAEDSSAQVVTHGDLTLTIAAGTKVLFSVEDFGVPHGHELRALRIADPTRMPFVDAASPPATLYATTPYEAAFSAKVALTMKNTGGFVAGSAVRVQVLSGLVNDVPPAGRWHDAATAHVSADGKTITTDPGEGIMELTWIALRTP
jgi:hypothetical protein